MTELESDFDNFADGVGNKEDVGDLLIGSKYKETKSEMTNVNEVDSFSRECLAVKDIKCEEENTIDSIECSFCKKNLSTLWESISRYHKAEWSH
jgi:hypothetical protein